MAPGLGLKGVKALAGALRINQVREGDKAGRHRYGRLLWRCGHECRSSSASVTRLGAPRQAMTVPRHMHGPDACACPVRQNVTVLRLANNNIPDDGVAELMKTLLEVRSHRYRWRAGHRVLQAQMTRSVACPTQLPRQSVPRAEHRCLPHRTPAAAHCTLRRTLPSRCWTSAATAWAQWAPRRWATCWSRG